MNYGEVGTTVNYGGATHDVGPDTGVKLCRCCGADYMGRYDDNDLCDGCDDSGECDPRYSWHCDHRNGHECDGSMCEDVNHDAR